MMRKRAKSDANQATIVAALRKAGASVQILSGIGGGCPDLLVERGGVNYLIEVKNSALPPSKQQLTDDETAFEITWQGQWDLARDIKQALLIVGL